MAKPTRDDVFALLPASAAVQPATLIERVDIATGIFYLAAHGLSDDAPLELVLVTEMTLGAAPGALPGGAVEGHTYGASPVTAGSFRLKTSPGGTLITSYSTDPVGEFSIRGDPWTDLDAQIDRSWRYMLSQCTAHGGDVESGVLTDMAAAHAANAY